MTSWIIPPIAGLIEPAMAPEFYVDKTGAVEQVGGCLRFYLATQQHALEAADLDTPHYVVVGKLIVPIVNIPKAIAQLAACLAGDEPIVRPRPQGPWQPHLVKG